MLKAEVWTDGCAVPNPGEAGIGVVVKGEKGEVVRTISKRIGHRTNNQAEWIAAIAGVMAAIQQGATTIHLRTDSKLVVEQTLGNWRVKSPDLRPFHDRMMKEMAGRRVTFEWVPRDENEDADLLSMMALERPFPT